MLDLIARHAPALLMADLAIFVITLAVWSTRNRWTPLIWPQTGEKTPADLKRGRHRLADVSEPYRPISAPPAVIRIRHRLGIPAALTDDEKKARVIPMPVAEPAWRSDATAVVDVPMPPAPLIGPDDRTFLESVTPQPPADAPDPSDRPDTPVAWFETPSGDTRQLEILP